MFRTELLFTMFEHFLSFLCFAALPQHDPRIEGIEKNYYEGEFVFGNCTSDFSFPPPYLAWYINDRLAGPKLLQPYHESSIDAYGFKLLQRSLELRFRIDKKNNSFISNLYLVKCVAQIGHLAMQMRETKHQFYVSSSDDLRVMNMKSSGKSLNLNNP